MYHVISVLQFAERQSDTRQGAQIVSKIFETKSGSFEVLCTSPGEFIFLKGQLVNVLFIYFSLLYVWSHWVLVAARGLSLAAGSRGCCLVAVLRLLIGDSFSCCGVQAAVVTASDVVVASDSVVVAPRV